jgi:hypothetical protein
VLADDIFAFFYIREITLVDEPLIVEANVRVEICVLIVLISGDRPNQPDGSEIISRVDSRPVLGEHSIGTVQDESPYLGAKVLRVSPHIR